MAFEKPIVPVERIHSLILTIRGMKVMLDADLAKLYGIPTKRLNEQVKRNRSRFPKNFMFKLTIREKAEVVANCDHLANLKFSKAIPNAFTEHGALMVASVLNTKRAIDVSVYAIRAFVQIRKLAEIHMDLYEKLAELELTVKDHDNAIQSIMEAIRQLLVKPEETHREPFGFHTRKTTKSERTSKKNASNNGSMN